MRWSSFTFYISQAIKFHPGVPLLSSITCEAAEKLLERHPPCEDLTRWRIQLISFGSLFLWLKTFTVINVSLFLLIWTFDFSFQPLILIISFSDRLKRLLVPGSFSPWRYLHTVTRSALNLLSDNQNRSSSLSLFGFFSPPLNHFCGSFVYAFQLINAISRYGWQSCTQYSHISLT